MVSWFGAAQDALVGWADDLDAKVVQLKAVVLVVCKRLVLWHRLVILSLDLVFAPIDE